MASGIDQGYCFNYWRLSYRRRFIRDLWVTPVAMALIGILVWWLEDTAPSRAWIWAAVVAIVGVASATYNYRMWKAQAADSETH